MILPQKGNEDGVILNKRMIVVDVETTGLIHLSTSILNIGALDFNNPR
jgi:DNA polymerase III epsilon subunit-like protein